MVGWFSRVKSDGESGGGVTSIQARRDRCPGVVAEVILGDTDPSLLVGEVFLCARVVPQIVVEAAVRGGKLCTHTHVVRHMPWYVGVIYCNPIHAHMGSIEC